MAPRVCVCVWNGQLVGAAENACVSGWRGCVVDWWNCGRLRVALGISQFGASRRDVSESIFINHRARADAQYIIINIKVYIQVYG